MAFVRLGYEEGVAGDRVLVDDRASGRCVELDRHLCDRIRSGHGIP